MFDFDKTIIDCDSDNWVVDDFGATERFDELLETMPWNTAIVCIISYCMLLFDVIFNLLFPSCCSLFFVVVYINGCSVFLN